MNATVIALAAALTALASQAMAEPICADRAQIVERLAQKYDELPQALGLSADGGVLEILASAATQTWTIIVTYPDRSSCIVAAGEAWELLGALKGDPA